MSQQKPKIPHAVRPPVIQSKIVIVVTSLMAQR
nr:MAG TPA_asm: hypothetical protein [Caudoviricetes sp.]DAY83010.1 MAG TPA: hypothetical protein [Caudoviricetes sp.]